MRVNETKRGQQYVYSAHPSRQGAKESRTGFLGPMALPDSATVLRTGDTEIVIEEASEAMKAEVRSISRTRLGQSSYIRDRLIYGSREYETHTHT